MRTTRKVLTNRCKVLAELYNIDIKLECDQPARDNLYQLYIKNRNSNEWTPITEYHLSNEMLNLINASIAIKTYTNQYLTPL